MGINFLKAKPIWLEDLTDQMNIQAVFSSELYINNIRDVTNTKLFISAASLYKILVNNRYVGYGPARAAHGYARVDVWEIGRFLLLGTNQIDIEVAGYNCYSYYTLKQPSFVQAEVVINQSVMTATGFDFTGYRQYQREQKVMRYSFQRTFTEVWNKNKSLIKMKIEVLQNNIEYLKRTAPYPDASIFFMNRILGGGTYSIEKKENFKKDRFIKNISDEFSGFHEEEIVKKPYYDMQQMVFSQSNHINKFPLKIKAGEYVLLDMGLNRSGFIMSEIETETSCHYMVSFDEKLVNGIIDYTGLAMINLVDYELPRGEFKNETFEVYGFRYAMIIVTKGSLTLKKFAVRSYTYHNIESNPHIKGNFDIIYKAAVETFRQNSVDVFMDCPTRERGGWLCDSFFTARSEYSFTKDNELERCFIENFRLYNRLDSLPEGMLPMCYPADHPDGNFIPQWSMWFILELGEAFDRSSEISPSIYKRLCYDLLGFFERYENTDGLLEDLPGWNFIEWSKANDWVRNVNYPTNMLYAKTCSLIGNWYDDELLIKKSKRIGKQILKYSFDGKLFHDHAIRDENMTLVLCDDKSEVCQYYAILFLNIDVTQSRFAYLYDLIIHKFSMMKNTPYNVMIDGKENIIEPANAIMGNYLRMDILFNLHRYKLLKEEILEVFKPMAYDTGTLWEYDTKKNSLNHGFASYAGVIIKKLAEINQI